MKLKRYIFIYTKLQYKNIRSIVEFRTDFVLMIIFTFLSQICNIIFLNLLFGSIADIAGWNMWQLLILNSLLLFSEGSVNFFFQGSWKISDLINSGELDRFLLRPIPIGLQLLTSKIDIDGLNKMILAIIIFAISSLKTSIRWHPVKIFFFPLIVINACIIRVCITWISSCLSFWMESSKNSLNYLSLTIGNIAKYPICIYPFVMRIIFLYIFPYAFVSYYPTIFLFDKVNIIPYLFISYCICILLIYISNVILKKGMERYESVGS